MTKYATILKQLIESERRLELEILCYEREIKRNEGEWQYSRYLTPPNVALSQDHFEIEYDFHKRMHECQNMRREVLQISAEIEHTEQKISLNKKADRRE